MNNMSRDAFENPSPERRNGTYVFPYSTRVLYVRRVVPINGILSDYRRKLPGQVPGQIDNEIPFRVE